MDTERCSVFLCVLECGSLSAAADKLGYTPSGISRMVFAMEQDAGFPLLNRNRRGITATAECEKLLPIIREISRLGKQYAQMAAHIQGLEIGEISIGTSYRSYYPWLTRMVADFVQSFPHINIHIREGNSSRLVVEMQEHQLDFCIISKREGDFQWIALQKNPIMAWLPHKHPYAEAEAIPLSVFQSEPFIDTYPNQDTDNARIFKDNHIKPNVRFSTTDNYATYSLVEAGLGISLDNGLNTDEKEGRVITKPLSPPQMVEIGIAMLSLEVLSPAAQKFVCHAQQYFDKV